MSAAKTCSSQSDDQNMDNNRLDDLYEILGFMGEGSYGEVMKCFNKEAGEIVAVKIMKNTKNMKRAVQKEVAIYNALDMLEPDMFNIVRCFRYLETSDGRHLLEFEMLDLSVYDLMENRRIPFSLNEIRPMAEQLLLALEGLECVGIMHTDIKPDNIMLVDHKNQPFKVKLIDFGLAMHTSDAKIGMRIQPLAYRAPEVTLGLPLSEAVDMWSLGCCLMEWYLSDDPFIGLCPYDHLQKIIHLIGVPDNELLQKAAFANEYFTEEGLGWRLKTPSEYGDTKGEHPEMSKSRLDVAEDLEDVIKNFYRMESGLEFEDRLAFLDLLKKMFHLNPEKRITPPEALTHPFITRKHLISNIDYIRHSERLLTYSPTQALPRRRSCPTDDEERASIRLSTSPSSVTSESSRRDTSYDSPDRKSSSLGSNQSSSSVSLRPKTLGIGCITDFLDFLGFNSVTSITSASITGISERAASCSSPTNATKSSEERSGTKPSQGQIPEISSSKSTEPPSATSEKVTEDSARPDSKPKYQCIIGPITVQNDERSVEHGAASQHPNQDANNEEQTDTGPSNASDTAGLRPIRPLSEVEDTKPRQSIPRRVVTTKIRIEVQQSGAFRRRTTRIANKL